MIDNIELIKPLLKFESEDDYYFVQILQRKKDNADLDTRMQGSNNSSRLIKAYDISSIEYLESRYHEMKEMAKLFNARVGLCLNKRSYHSSSLQMMVRLAKSLQAKNYRNARAWNNVSGVYHPIKDKTWIIDIDKEDEGKVLDILSFIRNQKPDEGKSKRIVTLPSKSGRHLIVKPFDMRGFDRFDVDVHKNNPTNLFIP